DTGCARRGTLARGGSPGKVRGCAASVSGGLGNARSTPAAAYVSTMASPARACALEYLPRLKPATGMGTFVVQRLVFSVAASGCSTPSLSVPFVDTRVPVASKLQPDG